MTRYKRNNASTSREKPSIESRARHHAMFMPTLSLREYLSELVADGKLTREQATACLHVKTAKGFQEYVDSHLSG